MFNEVKADFNFPESELRTIEFWKQNKMDTQVKNFGRREVRRAMTILARWFIVKTRLDWEAHAAHCATKCARDPELLHLYEIDILPALSVTNVRTLLRPALPLPQLSITR